MTLRHFCHIPLSLLLGLAACDYESPRPPNAAGRDLSSEARDTAEPTPDSSAPDTSPDISEPPVPESMLTVIDTMGFATESSPGVVAGFDLDERVTPNGDAQSCGHSDFIDGDGREGIDNQLATIVPLFELTGIGAAESLIQGAIKDGGLILMFELDDLDDLDNDPSLTLMLRAGQGVPLLGTDGLLLAGQTFALHPNSPDSLALNATLTDGLLEAGPFEARLPVQVFGVSYTLNLHGARVRARLTEDGGLTDGVLGGAVPYTDLLEIGRLAAMDDGSVLPAIEAVFSGSLDMEPDAYGNCTAVSGAFEFTAVSGFLF
jgi:hypothetical protein